MSADKTDRRRFLKDGAALAGLAASALAVRSASAQDYESTINQIPKGTPGPTEGQHFDAVYGVRSRYEIAGRLGGVGAYWTGPKGKVIRPYLGSLTPLQNSAGIITPAALHYYISHGIVPPDINPQQHRLLIHGMVDRPLIFTMDDVLRLPSVTRTHFIECSANTGRGFRSLPEATVQQTHGLTSCSIWTGVKLSRILEMVGAQKGASWIVAEGAEGQMHSKSIPIEKAMDDCLVAYAQNGEAVRPEQGYPLRLLTPGWEGVNNVKWLRRIKVVDGPYLQERETDQYQVFMEAGKYADGKARWFQFQMGPKSVITRPSGGQRLGSRGFHEITGLAWSGAGAIRGVEVSTDNGRTWKDAELQGPVLPKAHTRFTFGWDWSGEETVLLSRSTDVQGQIQPTLAEVGKIWDVNVEYFRNNSVSHTNAIQPWKVKADGGVYNALF
jgi:sulfane dehydrogenase subunit SoxC